MKNMLMAAVVVTGLAQVSCIDPKPKTVDEPRHPNGAANVNGLGQQLVAGQFVVTIIDNASFFNDLPIGEVMPDLFLMKGVSMRVIAPGETYAKVELDDGRIGYVMAAMLVAQPSGGQSDGGITKPVSGVPDRIDPGLPPVLPGN